MIAQTLNAYYNNRQILRNIDISIPKGKFTCVIGPNGCGKSTLLKLLAGIKQQSLRSSGIITINSNNIKKLSRKQIAQQVSFMPQAESSTWDFSVEDTILTGRFSHTEFSRWYSKDDRQIIESIMNELNLGSLKNRSVNTLSGGEFQRVRIARSIAQQSNFLLLDEPIANLDFTCQNDIMLKLKEIAHEKNIGVVMAIHDINLAAVFADKILLVNPIDGVDRTNDQTQFGNVEEIITKENLCKAYKTTCDIYTHPILHCPQIVMQN